MTNEKMLEKIMMVKNTLSEQSQKDIDMLVNKNIDLTQAIPTMETNIASIIILLKNDLTVEESKKNGKSNQLKAAKEILKNAQKAINEACHYAKTINGNQYICDGYFLVKFVKPFELPECPENLTYMNVEEFFEKSRSFEKELTIPDKAKLKTYIKMQKAQNKGNKSFKGAVYNFGANMPMLQATYLLNAMECMECDYKIQYKDTSNAVHFIDEIGNEVLLMPISKKSANENFVDEETII